MSRRLHVVALAALLLGLAMRAGAAEGDAGKAPETPPEAPAYVGDNELCTACHADQGESLAKTPHGTALAGEDRPASQRGCEACHGPGQAHVDAGGGEGVGNLRTFAKSVPAAQRSAPCLGCHGGKSALHDFTGGEHAKAGLACPDCHRMHDGVGEKMLAKTGAALCYGCHLDIRAKFALPEHHKVNEGVVACIDCHEPHGSKSPRMLKGADDRPCLRCHGDVEGPFVFEHVGNVTEGCKRCHEPHGSTGRHLLIRQQVAQLCYECHTATPTSHVQPSYRDCTRCHVSIHGSNTDPRFLEQ